MELWPATGKALALERGADHRFRTGSYVIKIEVPQPAPPHERYCPTPPNPTPCQSHDACVLEVCSEVMQNGLCSEVILLPQPEQLDATGRLAHAGSGR